MPAIPYEARKQMVLAQVKAAGPEAMKIFKQAFKSPEDLEFAAMCALREPAGARYSDRALDEKIHKRMSAQSDINRKDVLAIGRRAGVNVSGKVHMGSLGPPSDPDAWVTCADDVRKVIRKKNLNCEGAIKHQGYMPDPKVPQGKTLAPDLINEMEVKYTSQDPDLAAKVKKSKRERRKLREMIVDKHGRKPG